MVDHLNVSYLYKKRVPCYLKSYYRSDQIIICLKTKSNVLAVRVNKSLYQRLDNYRWIRLDATEIELNAMTTKNTNINIGTCACPDILTSNKAATRRKNPNPEQ